MLSSQHRMRASADFSTTVRSGVRSGRRNLVLYAAAENRTQPTAFGFIVSKAVGNAVIRNRVKRRLRELAATSLRDNQYSHGLAVVVRALPAAASADFDALEHDYRKALKTAVIKLTATPTAPARVAPEEEG
ncbi:ribonuclease P protein component [Arthrobacter sp. CAU 1506]|uniref:ribonuclease P protein component n=1 Tax=Arthrobacter sp. CAU 1506 TaxID=2560052 RepID=UPI0010AD4073|nr:ribonuclease P protein component [Arthrobacter sp. CAU 1506]TJY70031.1 ribonuclease P protein component [Arthrobacter sp. CAU 1506]